MPSRSSGSWTSATRPCCPATRVAHTPRSRPWWGRCSPPARRPCCSAATTRSPSRACARAWPRTAPVGVVHFDTHTDTGEEVFGVKFSHGTFMRTLVDDGQVDAARYAQIGLRGYWPGEDEFAWQAERGITSLFMHEVRDLGIREVVARALRAVGDGPAYLTVDIDVLDPAFVPGTGTPEPGGLTSAELLWAVREVAQGLELVGADLVEVLPSQVGTADASALVADRIVREILTGIALRRRARTAAVRGRSRSTGGLTRCRAHRQAQVDTPSGATPYSCSFSRRRADRVKDPAESARSSRGRRRGPRRPGRSRSSPAHAPTPRVRPACARSPPAGRAP